MGPSHHCPHTADAVSSATLPRATALPSFAPAALSIPRPSFAPSPQVRWNDATQTRLQPPVTIGNEEDPGFWKPFNSLAEYLIAGRGLSVSQVFDWEADQQWHHVAVSWNSADGEVRVWIDGSNSTDVFGSVLTAPHGVGKTLLGQETL